NSLTIFNEPCSWSLGKVRIKLKRHIKTNIATAPKLRRQPQYSVKTVANGTPKTLEIIKPPIITEAARGRKWGSTKAMLVAKDKLKQPAQSTPVIMRIAIKVVWSLIKALNPCTTT